MSSQLTRRSSLDAESELAAQEPPPWIIRSTAWLLIATFLFALLILCVAIAGDKQLPSLCSASMGADSINPSVVITSEGSRFVALGSLIITRCRRQKDKLCLCAWE